MNYSRLKIELEEHGYLVLDNLYSDNEIHHILNCIDSVENNEAFLKTNDLFAIRQLITHIPDLKKYLFNENLVTLIATFFETDYFLTKAIYFDKPNE